MSATKEAVVAIGAELVPAESITMLVLRHLLEGKMVVRVTIDGQTHEGYVHRLDFGKGAEYVFANIWVDDLEMDETIKVSINLDGTVTVLSAGAV